MYCWNQSGCPLGRASDSHLSACYWILVRAYELRVLADKSRYLGQGCEAVENH